MAVAPTGAMYKSLTFDGEDSRNYGVYITGQAVYNAPERDVEMVTIPGRNGAFALDNGRFQNITVSYPAGIFADDETDFAQAVSDFRNFLCSRKGYVRLQDGYNPNEYRMAVYKSGLEVTPAQLKAGEFTITFDCKPQRWLTSGESAVTVADGSTLMNPTLFESSPLLEVEGYGTIGFNGYGIKIDNNTLGNIVLIEAATKSDESGNIQYTKSYDYAKLNRGDSMSVDKSTITVKVEAWGNLKKITSLTINTQPAQITNVNIEIDTSGDFANVSFDMNGASTTYPPASANYDVSFKLDFTMSQGVLDPINGTITLRVENEFYKTQSDTLYRRLKRSVVYSTNKPNDVHCGGLTIAFSPLTAVSSVTAFGNPTYIDCDLGEAYMIKSGTPISLNQYIDLGSDLPKLASGANTISYDNTITSLKITPKWWKV